MVSSEESRKSKKYRTYRDLESLKARKEQTEKLNKVNLTLSLYLSMSRRFQWFPSPFLFHTARLAWRCGMEILNKVFMD